MNSWTVGAMRINTAHCILNHILTIPKLVCVKPRGTVISILAVVFFTNKMRIYTEMDWQKFISFYEALKGSFFFLSKICVFKKILWRTTHGSTNSNYPMFELTDNLEKHRMMFAQITNPPANLSHLGDYWNPSHIPLYLRQTAPTWDIFLWVPRI